MVILSFVNQDKFTVTTRAYIKWLHRFCNQGMEYCADRTECLPALVGL